jgi:hypothetical protein
VSSDVTAPGGLDQPKKPSGECVRLGLGEVIKQETTEATGQEDVSFSLSFPIHPSLPEIRPRSIDSPLLPSSPQPGMGRLFLVSLPATTGDVIIYRCKHCDTHLAYATDIISKVPIDRRDSSPLSFFFISPYVPPCFLS